MVNKEQKWAWVLTGSGHFFSESIEIINSLGNVDLFVSKAAEEVLVMYKKKDKLAKNITIYKDKTFSFVCKQPPASALIKKAAKIASGSGEPHKTKVATITKEQVMEIVKIKKPDLNTEDDEAAARIIAGSARQMGIEIEGM